MNCQNHPLGNTVGLVTGGCRSARDRAPALSFGHYGAGWLVYRGSRLLLPVAVAARRAAEARSTYSRISSAVSGHAPAAPPMSTMNLRRLMRLPQAAPAAPRKPAYPRAALDRRHGATARHPSKLNTSPRQPAPAAPSGPETAPTSIRSGFRVGAAGQAASWRR